MTHRNVTATNFSPVVVKLMQNGTMKRPEEDKSVHVTFFMLLNITAYVFVYRYDKGPNLFMYAINLYLFHLVYVSVMLEI